MGITTLPDVTLLCVAPLNLNPAMTRVFTLLLLAGFSNLSAQLNCTLRDHLDYEEQVNDVWGYVAPDGTEYAIVGTLLGVSFVSLADPDDIREVAFVEGQTSQWRDMKTFGEYAYSVIDEEFTDQGITAFDLRGLPDTVIVARNTYQIPGAPIPFIRAHNIYVDTSAGLLYTAGGDRRIRNGGPLVFDLKEDPMKPRLAALGPATYAHDVYVHGGIMYSSELRRGDLALYDVGNITNIGELGRTQTPFSFTHNAWPTTDGQYVFVTDERADASVAAYDISDPRDIRLIDEYRPNVSIGRGVIPHNVHEINEYLSISYYTDGLRVVDASVPDNLVEVANYDTWSGPPRGFNGAWGAYPYLPSGLTLISDLQSGLFVVDVNYKRAARLVGNITDRNTGAALNAATIDVISPENRPGVTDALGRYATGVANSATYRVEIYAEGYVGLGIDVPLTEGETFRLDTSLTPFTTSTLNATSADLAVSLFPNPSASEFNVTYDVTKALGDVTLRITDATGRTVTTQRMGRNASTLAFGANLPKGLYLVELYDDDRRAWVGKAVKQ